MIEMWHFLISVPIAILLAYVTFTAVYLLVLAATRYVVKQRQPGNVEPFQCLAGRFFEQVGETVESRRPPSEEAKEKCRALGRELAKKAEKDQARI